MTSDPLYRSDAAVGARDRASVPEVVFYQVKHRFVDNERSIPDEAADIIYYTLAIGHHTGIIDASEERLRCSLRLYERICSMLPEGEARYKLEAVLRGGEVYIDKFKAPALRTAIEALRGEAVLAMNYLEMASNVASDPWGIGYAGMTGVAAVNAEDAKVATLRFDVIENAGFLPAFQPGDVRQVYITSHL